MRREIIIAVTAFLIGTAVVTGVSLYTGLWEKTITDSQLNEVARKIIDTSSYRNVLLDRMNESGNFKGELGPQGPEGEAPRMELICTTDRRDGRVAFCLTGYVVTGCSAGGNEGPLYSSWNQCQAHDIDTDWTEARCCAVQQIQQTVASD